MEQREHFAWPGGQRCAVSLTYDDAVPVHHQAVAPLLAGKGLTATFNVPANPDFTENTGAWKRVAELGHELGNHTLFHPCRREPPERFSWLAPHYDLCHYTRQRWSDEMRVANCLLKAIDGRSERTFGNTCCNTTIGKGDQETSLDDLIASMFVAGRGPHSSTIVLPGTLKFTALGHFSGDASTAEELRTLVERAAEQGGWIIFMFHGVGQGTHTLYIDTDAHNRFVDYLAGHADRIWTASMVTVAKYLKVVGHA